MKYNKGFASIAVLLIALVVLEVGGIVYFAGKNNSKQISNNPAYPPITQIFTTNTATNISSDSATLNATILGLMDINNDIGQSSYFKYGTSSTNLNLTSSSGGAIQGTLSKTINRLQSNTTYYFRAAVNYGSNSVPANSHRYGNIVSFKTISKIPSACNSNSAPSIKVLSPNGGQLWKIDQTYSVNWSVCNAPIDSWVRLSYSIPSGTGNIHYTRNCFGGGQVSASQGNYNWTISSSVFGCSDAGYTFPPNTSFQTKVKTELYTGASICDGFTSSNDRCVTGARMLHAQDESDNNFMITNLP